jgi:hypothetical protein
LFLLDSVSAGTVAEGTAQDEDSFVAAGTALDKDSFVAAQTALAEKSSVELELDESLDRMILELAAVNSLSSGSCLKPSLKVCDSEFVCVFSGTARDDEACSVCI